MKVPRTMPHVRRSIAVMLVLAALWGCVAIGYQRPGQQIEPHRGKTLVFGRLRFLHDGREFFPWNVSLVWPSLEPALERHLWLMRLGAHAVSAEIHPDPDGSLAIWLGTGDYALLGSTQLPVAGTAPYDVVALFRVPAGPAAAYAGDLVMRTESHEGWHAAAGGFGGKSVTMLPLDSARAAFERRHGTLPQPPVASPWCSGDHLPGFNDSRLATRGKELLNSGCAPTTE